MGSFGFTPMDTVSVSGIRPMYSPAVSVSMFRRRCKKQKREFLEVRTDVESPVHDQIGDRELL